MLKTTAHLGGPNGLSAEVIIDTGSNITLISRETLRAIPNAPKPRQGRRYRLVQIVGKASLEGYVNLDVVFETPKGPVSLRVEAYVIQGMTAPFIFGNDFADQFQLSIIRSQEQTRLVFGESGRSLDLPNLHAGPSPSGPHAYDVDVSPRNLQQLRNLRNRKCIKNERRLCLDSKVTVKEEIVIPPFVSKNIAVNITWPETETVAYVERVAVQAGLENEFVTSADVLVTRGQDWLPIVNLTARPLKVAKGEIVGWRRDPKTWLHQKEDDDGRIWRDLQARAMAIRAIHDDRMESKNEKDFPEGMDPVVGGPKAAEGPDDNDITKDTLLSAVDISQDLSPEQKHQVEKVLYRNHRAFGIDGRLGEYPAKVKIPLREGYKEVSLPPYSASPEKRAVIDKQLDTWLEQKVVEPSESPWGFPVIIVFRNGKPRFCVDYRKLNAMTIPDEFPLPRQSDIIQALQGSQWLTTLDALSGFTQLEIDERDRSKTAFRTHRGLHQFRRMPFGLRNGPSIFQRVMQNVLAPFLWVFALVYIDDIVIYSKTFEDHLIHLEKVLKSFVNYGITLSPGKTHVGYRSVLLLGQKVSRLGMSTHKEKVEAIVSLESPRNVSELQTFLGMMVYFASYIPFYAWIVAPLFDLLKKKVVWRWSEVEQEAFELCKKVLTSAPVRAYAVPGRGYRLYTDACDTGLAGILQQVQSIKIGDLRNTRLYEQLKAAHANGKGIPSTVAPVSTLEEPLPKLDWAESLDETTIWVERVIAYWSRILKPAERNYSPTEREALALKESLVKFQAYLEGERILAITDHAALTWSRTYQNVNRRLLAWGTVFAAYPNLEIVHRAGRVHSNVDPISRLRRRIPRQDGPTHDDQVSLELSQPDRAMELAYGNIVEDLEGRVLRLMKKTVESRKKANTDSNVKTIALDPSPLDPPVDDDNSLVEAYYTTTPTNTIVAMEESEIDTFVKGYSLDSHYCKVLESLRKEVDWSKPTYPHYFLGDDGLIYFSDADDHARLCVPMDCRAKVLSEMHDLPSEGGHAGRFRTYNRVASLYYWPRMGQDIKAFVRSCDVCQKVKPRRHSPAGLLQPIPIPSAPFEVVSMDFVTDLPECEGYTAILVIVCKLTKYSLFIPTTNEATEKDTALLFFKHVYSDFGIPRQVITDRDPRWAQSFWKELTIAIGTKRALTTAHHPQADGQTEVVNQAMEIGLRAFVNRDRSDWVKYLPAFKRSYNTGVHASTKVSPAYALYGYHPNGPESLLAGNQHSIPRQQAERPDALEMAAEWEAMRSAAKDALKLAQSYQMTQYNKSRRIVEFDEGDKVLINPHTLHLERDLQGKGRKLTPRFFGPFEIIQKISPITYRLRLPSSYQIHPVLSIAHLEPYVESPKEFGPRALKDTARVGLTDVPEFEVDRILEERLFPSKR